MYCKCSNSAIRFFLGVPAKTSNTALQGEMGWLAPHVKQWICIARQWCHYSEMDDERINKHVFKWAVNSKYHNWAAKCKQLYNSYNLDYLIDLDIPKSKVNVFHDIKTVLNQAFIEIIGKWT